MSRQRSSSSLLGSLLTCLGLVLLAFVFVWYQRQVVDWVRVWQFQPSAAVAAVANRAGLSDHGRFMFYTGEPVLADAATFNASCTSHERAGPVLGCYTGQRIYVYDIENQELDGVEEVTAAHEMLHAAYDRLSEAERERVDALIAVYVPLLADNKAFTERMNVYDSLPKAEQLNELHSVLGTEVRELSPELEAYYRQYFARRAEVTGLYAKYSGVFLRLEAESAKLAAQYNRLVASRNQLVEASNTEYQELIQAMQQFDNGPRTDAELARQLNARADAFNRRLSDVKAEVARIDAQLATIKAEIEAIALHNQELNKSIDSQLAPAGGV